MTNDLSPATEAFLNNAVANGEYSSRVEALETAVALLRQRQKLVEQLVESRRQLDDGDYLELDEEGLREYFDGLLNRARERAGNKQTS
jgi:Arc/MetJ-type ribon-helix-helix transcriptional regulator